MRVLLKTALKAKCWTIALLLDINESKKFLNLLNRVTPGTPLPVDGSGAPVRSIENKSAKGAG